MHFLSAGGGLYQNYNGFAATDTGYYLRTTTFSNTNGWAVMAKLKITRGYDVPSTAAVEIRVNDGAKQAVLHISSYFLETGQLSTNYKIQKDFTKDHTFLLVGKGSDFFLFIDGQLAIDGTGLMTTANATNQLYFGDLDTSSGPNADVVWDYVKDYNTAWLPPQFTSGSCSEAAFFSGDRTGILASLYNGGTLKSVREYCGVEREYIEPILYRYKSINKHSVVSTTSTSLITVADAENFVISGGYKNNLQFVADAYSDTAAATMMVNFAVDGATLLGAAGLLVRNPTANYPTPVSPTADTNRLSVGLHKIEVRYKAGSGTATLDGSSDYARVFTNTEALS